MSADAALVTSPPASTSGRTATSSIAFPSSPRQPWPQRRCSRGSAAVLSRCSSTGCVRLASCLAAPRRERERADCRPLPDSCACRCQSAWASLVVYHLRFDSLPDAPDPFPLCQVGSQDPWCESVLDPPTSSRPRDLTACPPSSTDVEAQRRPLSDLPPSPLRLLILPHLLESMKSFAQSAERPASPPLTSTMCPRVLFVIPPCAHPRAGATRSCSSDSRARGGVPLRRTPLRRCSPRLDQLRRPPGIPPSSISSTQSPCRRRPRSRMRPRAARSVDTSARRPGRKAPPTVVELRAPAARSFPFVIHALLDAH
jgi:hypothetical protein